MNENYLWSETYYSLDHFLRAVLEILKSKVLHYCHIRKYLFHKKKLDIRNSFSQKLHSTLTTLLQSLSLYMKMVFPIKNKQNFINTKEHQRPWSAFLWSTILHIYYCSDVHVRRIKIIAPKNPEPWKLSSWWEPSLNHTHREKQCFIQYSTRMAGWLLLTFFIFLIIN